MRSVLHQASAAGSLDLGGHVAVWQSPPDSFRLPLPWDGAVLGTLVDHVSLRGAPGELIICAVTVRPRQDASGLMLRPGPLTTEAGAVIAPTAWDVHHLLWWWQSPTGVVGGELEPTPELLAHDPRLVDPLTDTPDNRIDGPLGPDARRPLPVDLPAGDLHTFILSLPVPADAPPGPYEGEILIRSGGAETRLPYALQVLPIELASEQPEVIIELRSRLGPGDLSEVEALSERRMQSVLEDVRSLGARVATVAAEIPTETESLDDLEQALRLRAEVGMTVGPLLLHGTEPWLLNIAGHAYTPAGFAQHNGVFLARMRQVAALGEELGLEGLVMCGMPSAGTPLAHHQNVAAKACGGLGLSTYIEAQPGISHATAHIDYVSLCRDDEQDARAARRMGFRLWYRPEHAGLEDPAALRREAGFSLDHRGYAGLIAPYWQPSGDPLRDGDSAAKDRMLAYPSAGGPVRTLSWLGLREAITDRQYLTAAEDLLKRVLRTTGMGGFGARPRPPEVQELQDAWRAALERGDPAESRERLRSAMAGAVRWLEARDRGE
ncbi:MAG: hypothetical protein GF320_05990 [Armatimonadia bacterium]|nr:hypothetical protein [Armatimonadia bacterium]